MERDRREETRSHAQEDMARDLKITIKKLKEITGKDSRRTETKADRRKTK